MTNFSRFARRFDDLLGRIDSADIRVPEDSALIGLAADLVPRITKLLRDATDLLTEVENHYTPPEDSVEIPDTLDQIGLQISLEYAARDLNDIAFFARTDLRTAHDQLMAVAMQSGRMMALATHCESSLRRLRKALISVESAICDFEGAEPPERQWFDLEISLQIRKLYWNLRRETGGRNVDSSKPLDVRLRSVLYRIVAFRELSIYPLLRVEDRVSLRRLLKRIVEWLNSNERDEEDAGRLWQDLAAFAELLIHVSHRQELQDHDLTEVAEALRTLFPRGMILASVPAALAARLQALLGLDDELDELILAGPASRVEDWRAPLGRLQRGLSQPNAIAGSLDLLAD